MAGTGSCHCNLDQHLWRFPGWFLLACSELFLLAVGVVVVCYDLSGFVTVCRSSPASCPCRVL